METPSSRDSEAVNLCAASSLSEVYYDAEEVARSESAVAAALQESSSSTAPLDDKSVTSSSDKSETKISSKGFDLMSDDDLEQRLWRQHVDSMLRNINLTPPSSALAETEAVRKLYNSPGEGTEERRQILDRMFVPNIEGVSLHTALIREADASVTQAERSLESIPFLRLSPVKVTNVNFGTSATHMTATTFFGANEVIVQNLLPSFPSTSLLANVNPSSDKNGKTYDLDDAKTLHLSNETNIEKLDVDTAKEIAPNESKEMDLGKSDDDWYFNQYVLTGTTIDMYGTKEASEAAVEISTEKPLVFEFENSRKMLWKI